MLAQLLILFMHVFINFLYVHVFCFLSCDAVNNKTM